MPRGGFARRFSHYQRRQHEHPQCLVWKTSAREPASACRCPTQQEVVNGWTTIEYLNLLSEQQEQSNNRLDALLLLALLGGAVARATSRSNART